MTTLYLVTAEHGEYSGREVWSVRAFATEAEAKAFVVACEEAGRVRDAELAKLEDDDYTAYVNAVYGDNHGHPLDPKWQAGTYDRTRYTYIAVPFGPLEGA